MYVVELWCCKGQCCGCEGWADHAGGQARPKVAMDMEGILVMLRPWISVDEIHSTVKTACDFPSWRVQDASINASCLAMKSSSLVGLSRIKKSATRAGRSLEED